MSLQFQLYRYVKKLLNRGTINSAKNWRKSNERLKLPVKGIIWINWIIMMYRYAFVKNWTAESLATSKVREDENELEI